MSSAECVAAFFESAVGSHVSLPSWAAEVSVPWTVLKRSALNGVCLRPEKCIEDLSPSAPHDAAIEIAGRVRYARCANGDVPRLVAIVPERVPFSAKFVPFEPFAASVALRSISNHERTHADTLTRDRSWHSMALDVLSMCERHAVQDLWDATCETSYYSSMSLAKSVMYELVVPEEIIAMTNAVIQAPIGARPWVKKMQTEAHEALGAMVDEIASRWKTVEAFVGWLDGVAACHDIDRLRQQESALRAD